MAVDNINSTYEKRAFLNSQISVFFVDLLHAIKKIKEIADVKNVYVNDGNEKLEIYVFYNKENFDIEDEINKYILDWERDYAYFPEVFIMPLDTIDSINSVLPKSAVEI